MQTMRSMPTGWWPRAKASKDTVIGYIFISPFILGFFLWFLTPALVSAWMAFQDWNMLSDPRFVGLGNFRTMWQDQLFWQSLKVTAYYTLVSVPLGLVLAFVVALLMNLKVRGIAAFRTIYYLPVIVPAVANAILWAWILNTEFGLFNVLLKSIGLPKVRWLVDPNWALPALILMSLWGIGTSMVIYLAGLQGIPTLYYEAADLDGAGRWQKIWYITVPLMSPVIFFNLVMGIIGSFQVFTAGYLITGGGPEDATLFYVLYLYRTAFQYLKMGYGAALAWVLFAIIMTLVLVIFRYMGRGVFYEGESS